MDKNFQQEQDALALLVKKMHFSGQTYEAYPNYIKYLLLIKKSCAFANAEFGLLDFSWAQAIAKACEKLETENGNFALDSLIDAHPILNDLLNTKIAERANYIQAEICPHRHVNLSQGGRDVIITADTLFIHDTLKRVHDSLYPLETALYNKGREFNGIFKMGREDFRDTLPVDLGIIFTGYADMIHQIRLRIKKEIVLWNSCTLGASFAGTGYCCPSGFAKVATKYLSGYCGRLLIPNQVAFAAMLDSEKMIIAHSHFEAAAIAVGRIAKALILMSSGPKCGFGEIYIPAVQPGSSIMPGKVNPVVPDMIAQIAIKVCANHAGIAHAAMENDLEGGCDSSMIRAKFHESSEMLSRGISLFISKVIEGSRAAPGLSNENFCHSWRPGFLLIRKIFGEEQARRILKIAAKRDINYVDVLKEEHLLSEDNLEILFNPANMAKVQISQFCKH